MNIKLGLKVLLHNPVAVLAEGLKARQQQYFKREIASEYEIEKLPTIDLLDLIPNLDVKVGTYSFLEGTSLITDMVLLKSLARRYDNCSYLEIGSWRGESLANVSEVTADCTSLTLSNEEMRSLNFGEEFIRVHGVFSDNLDTVTRIENNSRTFDFSKFNKVFDLIFVDGDHSYEGVLSDSKNIFPYRRNEKSIIVWHDYGFGTEHVRYSTLKGILDGIPKDKHQNLFHVSNTMCAIYIEGSSFPSTYTNFPSYPNKKFSLHVVAERMETVPDSN